MTPEKRELLERLTAERHLPVPQAVLSLLRPLTAAQVEANRRALMDAAEEVP